MKINKIMILSCLMLLGLEQKILTKKEPSQVKKQQPTQSQSEKKSNMGDQYVEKFIQEINKISINKAQIQKAYEAYEKLINYAKKNKKMVINKSTKSKLKKAVGKLPSLMILGDIPIPKKNLRRK